MQVVGHVVNVHARQCELLQWKVEQGAIVRLEKNFSADLENLPVHFQKSDVRQAAFGVTFFWPRIAKIYVEPVDDVFAENFRDVVHVEDNQPDVR